MKQCSKNEKLWSQKRKQITFCSDIQDSITVFEIRPEYIENPNANSYKFIVWEFQQVVYLIFHRSKSFFEYRILKHFWQYEYQSRKCYCHRFFRCCLFFSNYPFNFQVKQHYCQTRRTILQKYWSGCWKCETWFYPPKLNFPYSKPSLISINFECWKERSLIKQLVHELMTFKMLMELYTSISTLAQKLVLTPLNNKYVLKILESILLTLKICNNFC